MLVFGLRSANILNPNHQISSVFKKLYRVTQVPLLRPCRTAPTT